MKEVFYIPKDEVSWNDVPFYQYMLMWVIAGLTTFFLWTQSMPQKKEIVYDLNSDGLVDIADVSILIAKTK